MNLPNLITANGRQKAVKATRDSKWGKWGAIIFTALLTILTNHCESVDRRKEMKDERDRAEQRWHAQKAVNDYAVGGSVANAISDRATNAVNQTKESK